MRQVIWTYFCVLFFCVSVTTAEAASLYIDPGSTEISPGDTLSLAVRIDTDDDECINVVDGVITYDPGIIPVDISRGNSIMPMWVEDPVIDRDNNRITFAGGIPNGYCGRIDGDPRLTNIILEIMFQAPGLRIGLGDIDPNAKVTFSNETSVLLNDGRGTKAQLQTFGSVIFVQKKPSNEVTDEWNGRVAADNVNPSEFSISLISDKSIYNGRYVITFNTTDKQSGLDHYEIMEEALDDFYLFGWGGVDAPWTESRSPYLLTDQSLNSTIRVKAVDKAGNEYIAVYTPDESMRKTFSLTYARIALCLAGGVILVVLIGSVLFYRHRKKMYETNFGDKDKL